MVNNKLEKLVSEATWYAVKHLNTPSCRGQIID